MGKSLFVQCAGEELVGCDPDGDQCDVDDGEFCARYTYPVGDG